MRQFVQEAPFSSARLFTSAVVRGAPAASSAILMAPADVRSSTTSPLQSTGSSDASPEAGGEQVPQARAHETCMKALLLSHSPRVAQSAQLSLVSVHAASPSALASR